jgi:hypothetical protein
MKTRESCGMVATRVNRMDVTPQGADLIVDPRLYFLE